MENQLTLMNESPVDGCLVLGRNGPTYSSYNTRFHVDRKLQRQHMTQEVLLQRCSPCCIYENQSALTKALWSVLRSESFLFFLHGLVLTIGVTKETLDLRHSHPVLHFNQSVMEMMLACFQMAVRAFLVWSEFQAVKHSASDVEFIEGEISFRGRRLRQYVTIYLCVVGGLVLVVMVTFGLLYIYANLGWTILTHNVSLGVATSLASVLTSRLTLIHHRTREDTHRVALLETVLLLRESFLLRGEEERRDYLNRVERFLNAFKNTQFFEKPDHIQVLLEYVPDWNMYRSGEQISVV